MHNNEFGFHMYGVLEEPYTLCHCEQNEWNSQIGAKQQVGSNFLHKYINLELAPSKIQCHVCLATTPYVDCDDYPEVNRATE